MKTIYKYLSPILIGLMLVSGFAIAGMVNAEKNLLVDGTMEAAGVANWTATDSATLTKETTGSKVGSQHLRLTYGGEQYPGASQAVITIGTTYRVRGWARGDGISSAYPRVYIGGGSAAIVWTGNNSNTWQYFDETAECTGQNSLLIRGINATAGDYIEYDQVFVTEYKPEINNAEKNLIADGMMEVAGVADWGVVQSGIITKETTDPVTGNQVLRLTYNGSPSFGATQSVLVVDKPNRIRGWGRGDGVNSVDVRRSGSTLWNSTSSTDWQYFDITTTPSSSYLAFRSNATAAGYGDFDDVFVTEYHPPAEQGSLTKQLIGYWPLTTGWLQSATVVSDRTANGNHGTINGDGVTVGATSTDFDGSDDYIRSDSNIFTDLDPFTTCAWVDLDSVTTRAIYTYEEADNSPVGFLMFHNSTNGFYMYSGATSDANAAQSTLGPATVDTWYFVCGQYDSVDVKLWIDGVAQTDAITPVAPNITSSSLLTIGARGSLAQDFDGQVADVRMWGRGLSQTEINLLFDQTCAIYSACD